ncbi:MAG: aldehyde dehydrogenase, partial [Clostridiales bacterium]|nr:aldehyde dehydrogenase [Clostridiales bacterium]
MSYTNEVISGIVDRQRAYFRKGETLDVSFRVAQLKKLKQAVLSHEQLLENALHEDLGRSRTEAYLCDLGPVIVEINETIRGLRRWARPEKHYSGLMCFPSLTTTVYKMPYGVS